MIQPISKASQMKRSALKVKAKVQKAVAKVVAQKAKAKDTGGEVVGEKMRADVMIRDGHKCVLCHTRGDADNPLQVHHVIPRSRGGKAVEENLATLCRKCNNGIGARVLDILRAIGHAIRPDAELKAVAAEGLKRKKGAA